MVTVELFDREKMEVVDSLTVDPDDKESINKWLITWGLGFNGNELMDVTMMPFRKTKFALRNSKE